MTDKLRILLLASESLDLFYLPTSEEQRAIEDRISTGSQGDRFEVIPRPSIKLSQLARELMKYDPEVVHLSAEGRPRKGILLEDDSGNPKPLSARELAALIRELDGNIRLLFLNACYTLGHANALSKEVDYVIGMKGVIEEKTSMKFSRHFYQALGYGRTVERAFGIAMKELEMGAYPTSDAPVLRIREGVDPSRPLFGERAVQWPEVREPEPDALLRELGTQFVTQLSIAGHFQDADQTHHAIYFDSDLYVHRKSAENALLSYVEKFAESKAAQGSWVCVIGDAGHGKSSLLWYLYKTLSTRSGLTILPFLAQLEGHWSGMETAALRLTAKLRNSSKLLVIIDTLDILVGTADPSLATTLNHLRSAGCMVIATSRRQEAERLFRITPSDFQVELRRFNDDEAQQAIRNYINLAFPTLNKVDRAKQFDKIWGILEQQRRIRELDLEPLILRMLFEAYVPKDIPQDINTQQVYRKFWNERVLFDRVVRDTHERFTREQLCRLVAREIGAGDGHSDKLSVALLMRRWKALFESSPFPHLVLEGLVSSGVLQWAEGVSTIRFFHQTFFEYAAAYDLLSSDASELQNGIKTLLNEVKNFNLFRAPILKQLAIQAFEDSKGAWKTILQGLRDINNELAAQIALEVVGKVEHDPFSVELCKEWIRTNGSRLQNIICETVRHYPRSKSELALDLLEPYLEGPRANAIYAACAETFAKDLPEQVCAFLKRNLPRVLNASDDEQKMYKEALCSTVQHGEARALSVLLDLFPHLKPGQQSGLLHRLSAVASNENSHEMAGFLRGVIQLMPEVKRAKQTEVWNGVLMVTRRLHEVSPAAGAELARWLVDTGQWKEDQRAATYTGMIASPALSAPLEIERSLSAIASHDHYERLLNTGLLCDLPERFSELLMERILSVKKELYLDDAQVSSLFTVVASLKGAAPKKVVQFLGEWRWRDAGVGTPWRTIIEYLALADPAATKEWLFEQLTQDTGPASPTLFSAFNILLQTNATVFSATEARHLYDVAFSQSTTIRQIFAGAAGSLAKLDKQLAQEIFLRAFDLGKDCQLAAVDSLAGCLADCPGFVFEQAGRILATAIATKRLGLLNSYLVVLKELPQVNANRMLGLLSDWFTEDVLRDLKDEKTLGELLTILKITCVTDTRLAFDFSKRVPRISRGVVGALAAVYDRISEYGEDESLLLELLDEAAGVSGVDQIRMRNALRRILFQLDKKLGGRKVVDMVLRTYKSITDERALKTFIDAALRVPSWTEEDSTTLLKNPDLPSPVRALIAAKRIR